MDANFAISYFNKITKEAFTEGNKEEEEKGSMLGNLFALLILFGAVYLSWTCNSKCTPDMNVVEKVFRAFFAGFFGLFYLIIYFIAWSPACNACVAK
jgi:hypothetical protein